MIEIRTSGVKRFTAKTQNFSLNVRSKFAEKLANYAYDKARSLAPRDTGALIKAIMPPQKGKQSAKLKLIQPTGSNRPYHLWMHGIKAPGPEGKGYDTSNGWESKWAGRRVYIHSGDPKFMYTAMDEMKKKSTEMFKKELSKLK